MLSSPSLSEAIEMVNAGHAQRVCEPGRWIVSRGDDGEVCIATLAGFTDAAGAVAV